MDSASREVVDRKARLAGNGRVLAKRCNTAGDDFTARPKGARQRIQSGVAALDKDPAIAGGRRLVLDPLAGSESINVTLLEYFPRSAAQS